MTKVQLRDQKLYDQNPRGKSSVSTLALCARINRQFNSGDEMKSVTFSVLLVVSTFLSGQELKRPKITGIDHVAFYTTSQTTNAHLYNTVLGLTSGEPAEPGQAQRFLLNS